MIDAAVAIAKEAGALLLERYGRLTRAEISKKGPRDLVTAADRDSEALILARLRAEFPDHAILAEESAVGPVAASDVPTWIVDPLDGTTNYVQSIPMFCVSMGLVEAGKPVLGVIHAPALGQTFWGAPGQGAWEDDRPVSVSATPMLSEAVLATGFPYRRDALADHNLDNFVRVGMKVRGLRRLGAAALDLAYVASGRLDAFWELHLSPWDVAAGAALVLAAGGRVTDVRGGEAAPAKPRPSSPRPTADAYPPIEGVDYETWIRAWVGLIRAKVRRRDHADYYEDHGLPAGRGLAVAAAWYDRVKADDSLRSWYVYDCDSLELP